MNSREVQEFAKRLMSTVLEYPEDAQLFENAHKILLEIEYVLGLEEIHRQDMRAKEIQQKLHALMRKRNCAVCPSQAACQHLNKFVVVRCEPKHRLPSPCGHIGCVAKTDTAGCDSWLECIVCGTSFAS
jgi:hypothetical protein